MDLFDQIQKSTWRLLGFLGYLIFIASRDCCKIPAFNDVFGLPLEC